MDTATNLIVLPVDIYSIQTFMKENVFSITDRIIAISYTSPIDVWVFRGYLHDFQICDLSYFQFSALL
jgi:hypothetical protein